MMATFKEILHVLADGISLTGAAREQLHADIDALGQSAEVQEEAESADRHDGDVSRETSPVTIPGLGA